MKNRFIIIIVLLTVFSIAASLYARWVPISQVDLRLTLFFQSFNNQIVLSIMKWVSYLFGDWRAALLVLFIGFLAWWRLGKLEGIAIWSSGVISLVDDLIKLAVNRPRPLPEQVQIIGINHGNGYPSSHAFFATIFLGFLAYLLFIKVKNRSWKILSLILLIALILLVGASRIYLGAHWPSDVLGGYLIGGLFLALLIRAYEFLNSRLRIK
jgi:membrane-associated phospholipid phosphatase